VSVAVVVLEVMLLKTTPMVLLVDLVLLSFDIQTLTQ
jgi:hypothetical protein